MRRWLCVIVLLFGLAGQGYPSGPVAVPVPIERPLAPARGGRLQRSEAWWQAA